MKQWLPKINVFSSVCLEALVTTAFPFVNVSITVRAEVVQYYDSVVPVCF